MIYKRTITFLLLLLCSYCNAQFIFTNLQKKDGLSVNEVNCSYKDGEGFMWFGTPVGLNRYDGSGFRLYNKFLKNSVVIPNTVVTSVAGNGNDQLWVGTNNGLFLFDKAQESFTAIPFTTAGDISISRLLTDKQQRLWIVTNKGLFLFTNKKATGVSLVYPTSAALDNIVIYQGATSIDSLRNGIWAGCAQGIFFIDFNSSQTFSSQYNPGKKAVFDIKDIFSLATGKDGRIWISSEKHWLAQYDFESNIITDEKTWTIARNYALFVDYKNRVWMANYTGKIYVLEPGGRISKFPDDSPENYECSNIIFNNIFEDSKNNLWIAGPNGVSKLSTDNFLKDIITLPGNLFDKRIVNYQVNAICNAGNGNLWVCKDDGLYLLDVHTAVAKRYGISATQPKPNRFFSVVLINGECWCATGDGIKILNPATNQFRSFEYYPKEYPLSNVSCTWIKQDKLGMIWFSFWNNAVYRFDPVKKITVRIDAIRSTDSTSKALTNSLCAFENADGRLWIGNGTNGVKIYNYHTGLFTSPVFLNNITIHNICNDDKKNTWLATAGHGILKLDAGGRLVDSISVADGLSVSSIYELGFDRRGRLWAGSAEGIEYIHPNTKTVSRLNVDMGKPVHDMNGPMLLNDDQLFGSAVNKLAVIDLDAVDRLAPPAPPLISAVSVFEKHLPFSAANPVLKLKYDENFFVIEFASLTHNEIPSLQYAYKLNGFDKDWVYCGRRQTAAYTNVPNGHYTFLVKCTGADGNWTKKETSINILIQPPFWKTKWFIGAVLLLLALIAWYLFKLKKQMRQKQYVDNTIDYFANSIYGQNSVNEICWDIARNCISQLRFEDCVVYLLDKENNRLVQKAAYGPKNPKGHEIINPIEVEVGKGIVGTVALTGNTLMIADTGKDNRYIVDDEQRLSELAVPIIHDNKVIGVIDSEHSAKNFFTADHAKALSTIAAISANKIAEATAGALMKANEIKLLEINKMLAESQLMALRAQMNPHFVFNCLNSIQECIVTQKYGEASKYLNKFSKLFRMVLNNSGKNLVTIEEEKEVLELYLELEQMRFEKSFHYSFKIDEALETEEILIPSMLLQPYVENALWHGLMHKDGERNLRIIFEKVTEEVFRCIIDDDGIGRKRSFELKAQQSKARRHESKGLKISEDRINILQRQGYTASLQITDKYDEEQNAAGTRIEIELSNFLKS